MDAGTLLVNSLSAGTSVSGARTLCQRSRRQLRLTRQRHVRPLPRQCHSAGSHGSAAECHADRLCECSCIPSRSSVTGVELDPIDRPIGRLHAYASHGVGKRATTESYQERSGYRHQERLDRSSESIHAVNVAPSARGRRDSLKLYEGHLERWLYSIGIHHPDRPARTMEDARRIPPDRTQEALSPDVGFCR